MPYIQTLIPHEHQVSCVTCIGITENLMCWNTFKILFGRKILSCDMSTILSRMSLLDATFWQAPLVKCHNIQIRGNAGTVQQAASFPNCQRPRKCEALNCRKGRTLPFVPYRDCKVHILKVVCAGGRMDVLCVISVWIELCNAIIVDWHSTDGVVVCSNSFPLPSAVKVLLICCFSQSYRGQLLTINGSPLLLCCVLTDQMGKDLNNSSQQGKVNNCECKFP